ncbi:hypothetical protein B566_EDAN018236 [Ephemera danica]|nr:hypothetical protein B566_EDAN018236 [Ephemera danica]
MAKKERADHLVFTQGLAESREQAKRLIMAGQVLVGSPPVPVAKPGQGFATGTLFTLRSISPYVSRGAYKLLTALEGFALDVTGLVALDAGASTGGFTDCLLQRGAAKVYAVDVGKAQLHERLRADPRVISHEGVNIRTANASLIPEVVDIVVADVVDDPATQDQAEDTLGKPEEETPQPVDSAPVDSAPEDSEPQPKEHQPHSAFTHKNRSARLSYSAGAQPQAKQNPDRRDTPKGSQEPGMGRDLAEADRECMDLWKKAERISGLPLRAIYWEGDETAMAATNSLQPALTVVNLSLWGHLSRKCSPACVAGHSLGEYSALAAAGVLPVDTVLELVALRGRLMQEADPTGIGAMAAVLKLSLEQVQACVQAAAQATGANLVIANYNTPAQFVVSGASVAIAKLQEEVKAAKGRAVALPVSGAFHSPLMQEAATELAGAIKALGKGVWNRARFPVFANVTAVPAQEADALQQSLVNQMTGAVRWIETISAQWDTGVRAFVECGPKGLLSKMVGPILTQHGPAKAACTESATAWEITSVGSGEACIVGLPNVGKSTLFNALTKAQNAESANYPFCTIEPNKATVPVPDPRLVQLAAVVHPQKILHATVDFIDIAGLVRGASKGEGLGNQFLANIRECAAILHVVRCFDDSNITHVDGAVDPLRDIETIETELLLADMQSLEKRCERARKVRGDKAAQVLTTELEALLAHLNEGQPAKTFAKEGSDLFRQILQDLGLLTAKKVIYCANVDEATLADPASNAHLGVLMAFAAERGAEVVSCTPATSQEYLRLLAVSRLVLDVVPNIQASWVTMGPDVAQLALLFGANDFGSLMIEENVVAAAGVLTKLFVLLLAACSSCKRGIGNTHRCLGYLCEPAKQLPPVKRAYDYRILDKAVSEIVDTARNTGAGIAGPIPLPTNIHKYTVNRSAHVDKKSREQFEMRIHKRLVDILEPTQQTVDALGKLSLPAGVDVKNTEKDGYNAIQIAFDAGKEKHITKPLAGHFAKAGAGLFRTLRELRLEGPAAYAAGDELTAALFSAGDKVKITGQSIGKGTAGVMKRWNFAGACASHGAEKVHRSGGSIGNNTEPAKVWKGKKMAGHMGNRRVTTLNLEVVAIRPEDNVILVKGAVPGPKNGLVLVRKQ